MLTMNQCFVFRGQSIAWGKQGHGAPLVLVHGTPFSSQVWRKIAPWLARIRVPNAGHLVQDDAPEAIIAAFAAA